MTQRERILSIAVGGLIAFVLLQWGFTKYRTAVRTRNSRIESLNVQKLQIEEQLLAGAYAEHQMSEYLERSLPGSPERAQSDYQSWLLQLVQENQLNDPRVNPTSPVPVGGLYNRLPYRVDGRIALPNLVELLHAFYAKDYLHRISKLSITPARNQPGKLDLEMSIDVIALTSAPVDLRQPGNDSWRVDSAVAAYSAPILNRNFFEPPNKAPEFTGNAKIEVIVGKDSTTPLTFKDPDGHTLSYEFVEASPDFAKLDERTGTLTVRSEEKNEYKVLVRVFDNGYPRRTTEQLLSITVVDPPPPPVEVAKKEFDDSSQTVLTALVQGRDGWTAWLNVRTRGKTLKLRAGDQFEIGHLKGNVIDVTPKYVVLEVEGRRFELKPPEILAEAAKQSLDN
ncbi:hypothetical protein CA13_54090 [Planctomycetes bacterium CA13]|uniref:Cadherin domain-containing protein n=1 Tax=Novipirellula herctigrandis TaxID=2527986 RepID=A0A5C5Z9P4_9BACT|nr:hypothetical protein CA13_54090 [Planctomycetes bacterium CA13]